MTDPRALYPEPILDHSKHPRNQGKLANATHSRRLSNPLCGDRITLSVRTEGDVIAEVGFEARGCALCVASASMLTEWIAGRTKAEVRDLKTAIENAVDPDGTETAPPVDVWKALRGFPARKRCATLPWEALAEALEERR